MEEIGPRGEIGLNPIVGVPRWLAGSAQLEDVGDIAGHRRAIGAGGTIEGAAINAVATIADRLEIEPAIERAAREPEPVSDLPFEIERGGAELVGDVRGPITELGELERRGIVDPRAEHQDRKRTRLNSNHNGA